MQVKRSLPIVATFVISLAVTIALLIAWVVYIVRSASEISHLAGRVGVAPSEKIHWILLAVGCFLFALLLAGLTYQLAQALAARRYLLKQDEFVSNVTHELKSPLAAIRLHAQTLQLTGLTDADRMRSTGFIVQQSARMTRLVDNVLESSRMLARRTGLELEPVALRPFFTGYLEEVSPRIESRGVVLQATVDTAATVLATEEALTRVLDNLLDNAARFSLPGGRVRCLVADDDHFARITVEDDGVGIPNRELPRIFDRFYQAGPPSNARRAGSGLGLSIVAGLVREMRGEVEAFSQEGRPGTRFVIELPRVGPVGAGR